MTEIPNPQPRLEVIKKIPAEPDYDGRIEFYNRKLSYKLPITYRYGMLVAFFSGIVSMWKKKRVLRLPLHLFVVGNTLGLGLAYEELYGIGYCYYKKNSAQK
jgi:hypothetical protein